MRIVVFLSAGLVLGFVVGWLTSCAPEPPPKVAETTIDLYWMEHYPAVRVNDGPWRWLEPGERVGDAIATW